MKRVTSLFLSLLFLLLFASVGTQMSFAAEESFVDVPTDVVAPEGGIVPAGRDGNYSAAGYGSCEFVEMTNNVMKFLVAISALISVIVFIYAGYLMVYSRGDIGQIQQAKKLFSNVAIGFIILLTAFLVINTILGILVGSESRILNWQTIECQYSNTTKRPATFEVEARAHEYDGWVSTGGGGGGGGVSYGGSCVVLDSGPCSVANMQKAGFGSRSVEASQICNKESGGAPIKSGSDLCCGNGSCSGAPSFSGGYFQVNILAHRARLGCGSFFESNGKQTEGNCVRRNGKGICTGWSCRITNNSEYTKCMAKALDPSTNLKVAASLFQSSGFAPWANSARLCSIPK